MLEERRQRIKGAVSELGSLRVSDCMPTRAHSWSSWPLGEERGDWLARWRRLALGSRLARVLPRGRRRRRFRRRFPGRWFCWCCRCQGDSGLLLPAATCTTTTLPFIALTHRSSPRPSAPSRLRAGAAARPRYPARQPLLLLSPSHPGSSSSSSSLLIRPFAPRWRHHSPGAPPINAGAGTPRAAARPSSGGPSRSRAALLPGPLGLWGRGGPRKHGRQLALRGVVPPAVLERGERAGRVRRHVRDVSEHRHNCCGFRGRRKG